MRRTEETLRLIAIEIVRAKAAYLSGDGQTGASALDSALTLAHDARAKLLDRVLIPALRATRG